MKLFFNPAQVFDESGLDPRSSKLEMLLTRCKGMDGLEIVDSPRVKSDVPMLAHRAETVLDHLKDHPNGESALFTVGSVASACAHAYSTKEWAYALADGSNLARLEEPGDAFNSLVIGARFMLNAGARRVAIFDVSKTAGDGTQEILERLRLAEISNYSTANFFEHPGTAPVFLQLLPALVKAVCSQAEALVYHASVDSHFTFNGWMKTADMRRRDQIVFETAKELGIPVVTVMGAGYDQPMSLVLDLHMATLEEALKLAP